jgi:hypothetical protein
MVVAQLICGGGAVPATSLDVGVARIGRRSMDLVPLGEGDLAVLAQVRFAWIAVKTEGLEIRPLVEIVSASSQGASVRYRHLFPAQQAALDAFNAG